MYIKGCKGPAEARTLCNIYETKNLSNILFIRHKFFTIKMDEVDNIPDYIKKVNFLVDRLTCLKVYMKEDEVIMTLLDRPCSTV